MNQIYTERIFRCDGWWRIAVTLLPLSLRSPFLFVPEKCRFDLDSGDGLLIDFDADLMLIEELVRLGGCAAIAALVGAGGDRGGGYTVPVARQRRPPRRSRMLANRSYIYKSQHSGVRRNNTHQKNKRIYVYTHTDIISPTTTTTTTTTERKKEKETSATRIFHQGSVILYPAVLWKPSAWNTLRLFLWFLFISFFFSLP